MPAQVVDCRSYAFIDLDLFDAWIALDINDSIALEQIVVELLRAANIEDGVSVAIKLTDFFKRQPGRGILS